MICPVCSGRKVRYADGAWGPDPCIACGGSGEGPIGCLSDDSTKAKQRETRQAQTARRSNQYDPWSDFEDQFVCEAEREWRATGKPRRPPDWYANLSERLAVASHHHLHRSPAGIKQRILRLISTGRKL